MTHFCQNVTKCELFEKGFLSGISTFLKNPLQTIKASHFPSEKTGEFPWCLGILENQWDVKKGIDLFFRRYINVFVIPTHQIASKSEYFCWNPPSTIEVKIKVFVFNIEKILQIELTQHEVFDRNWHQIWWTETFRIKVQSICTFLNSFKLTSQLQIIEVIVVDLLSKFEICWCKIQFFEKFRNFWFWNFYFRWLYILEKMSNFDGWPGVG